KSIQTLPDNTSRQANSMLPQHEQCPQDIYVDASRPLSMHQRQLLSNSRESVQFERQPLL
ncbi:unnamed protein product, partial [Oikopleura dioica]